MMKGNALTASAIRAPLITIRAPLITIHAPLITIHAPLITIYVTFKTCFKKKLNIISYSNEVFLRVTNHTGQAEKNPLGPAGIRTRDLRPGQVDFSLLVRYGSSLGETPHYYSPPEFTVP